MKRIVIPERFQREYRTELARLFRVRINLFCYVVIIAFLFELVLAMTIFKGILSIKDLPGIVIGILFSLALLFTGRFARKSLRSQKTRAIVFSLVLIMISVLAATAHPTLIPHLGVALILLAVFTPVLLMPFSWIEATALGLFAIANFAWIYPLAGTYITWEIFGINIGILVEAVFVIAVVKRTQEILRKKDFVSHRELQEKSAIMAKELELAKKIHTSLIPHSIKNELADIAVTYKPMLYMGGDYAKFSFKGGDKLVFVLTDITGHGVSAALLVNRVHSEVERLIREDLSPGEILKALDEFIDRDFGQMGIFLTAFCGMLDFSGKKLDYSNYGHPPQILLQSRDNEVVLMRSQTFLMGIGMDDQAVYHNTMEFEPGDRIILFTDGLIEAKNKDQELFGQKRLERFAKDNKDLDVTEFNSRLAGDVDAFENGQQGDDIFLLTIQTK